MERIDLYNQISREIVKNYNTYLHPSDVKILQTLGVSPHFTISHVLNNTLTKELHKITLALKVLDSSLIINQPENYHITLFWKGLDSKLDQNTEEIRNILAKYKFSFEVEELLFGPLGVSVKFYPKDENFVKARQELYELTGTPYIIDERFVTTWVSLAAYSQIPQDSVKKYVFENQTKKFDDYMPESFKLYISNNKGLVNPQEIAEFKLA